MLFSKLRAESNRNDMLFYMVSLSIATKNYLSFIKKMYFSSNFRFAFSDNQLRLIKHQPTFYFPPSQISTFCLIWNLANSPHFLWARNLTWKNVDSFLLAVGLRGFSSASLNPSLPA